MKPTDALNSSFIGITTLHVSGSLSVHHQEFLAIHRHWYIFADLMTVCYQEKDGAGSIHSNADVNSRLLGYDPVHIVQNKNLFRRNVLIYFVTSGEPQNS
jgi:hypothetical protein